MAIFYKDKNYRDQYYKARFNGATREEARSKAELITLGIYGAMAAVALAVLTSDFKVEKNMNEIMGL